MQDVTIFQASSDTMDEMEEVCELLETAEDVMQLTNASEGPATRRRRVPPTRFHFTARTGTPAVGDHCFVKLHGTFHKAVIQKILRITEPPMYICVHESTSAFAGQVQAVPEHDITPACGTYNHYKRRRDELTVLASKMTAAWHSARSDASKRAAVTKKANKALRAAEQHVVDTMWLAYCAGEVGTHTWTHTVFGVAAGATAEADTQTCSGDLE